jgi:hypothetical protein
VFFELSIRNLPAKKFVLPESFKLAISNEIGEGHSFRFDRRLSTFINPCSLPDDRLPKVQTDDIAANLRAVATGTQELWPELARLE